MHFFAALAVAVLFAIAPHAMSRLPTRTLIIAALPLLLVMSAGVIAGLALYPASDIVVGGLSLLAGVVLGRAMPRSFVPFLILLLILSVLDVAQNIAFAGPSAPSTGAAGSTAAPGSHLIWLNFWLPLPAGHFNIGFADLLLISAISENLRLRGAALALTLMPGLLGLGLGEAILATLRSSPPAFWVAVASSLVVLLTAGYVLTELAVRRVGIKPA